MALTDILIDLLRILVAPRPFLAIDPDPAQREAQVATSIYRALMAGLPQGVVVCTAGGDVLDRNEQAAPLLGLDPAILDGLPLPTALEEAGRLPAGDPFALLAGGTQEVRLGPYGLGDDLELELRPFRVEGQLLALALISGGGSGSQAAAGGGLPLEVLDQGALEIDAEGRVVRSNPAALQLLELTREKVEGRPLAELASPLDSSGMAGRLVRQALATGSWTGMWKLQRGDATQEVGLAARAVSGDRILLVLKDLGRRKGAATGPRLPLAELVASFGEGWSRAAEPAPPSAGDLLQDVVAGIDCDLACFEAWRERGGEFEIAAVDARGGEGVAMGVVLPGSGASSERVRETGEPLMLPDLEAERRFEDLELFRRFRSGLKVPVRAGGRFLGVLGLWSLEPAHFRPEHAEAAALPAAVLAAGLLGTEAMELRRRVAEAESLAAGRAAALDRIGEAVLGLDDEGRIVRCNRAAERLTGLPKTELLEARLDELLGDMPDELRERLGRGPWKGTASLERAQPGGRAGHRRVELRLSGTAGDWKRGTPLVLVLRDIEQEERQTEMLGDLARQLETAERLLALPLDEAPDLAEFLASFTQTLLHYLSFEESHIYVPSEEGEALILQAAANGHRARLERDLYFPREGTLVGEAAGSGEAAVHRDLAGEASPDAVGFQEEGFRSAAFLPLPSTGEGAASSIHALLVLLATRPDAFRVEDLGALRTLTGPLARALDRLGPAGARGEIGGS